MENNYIQIHAEIDKLLTDTGREKSSVIAILQAIQAKYNYLPREALERVCEMTDITPAEITGVASFYSQFRFEPAGKHVVKVCEGTACHVKGALLVHDAFERVLDLQQGRKTDAKNLFTLEKVSCLGCCTLAPVVQIDDVTYGHVNPKTTAGILNDFLSQGVNKKKNSDIVTVGDESQGEIRIGLGSCCIASGSGEIKQAVLESVKRNDLNVKIREVGCVGMCHQVPLVEVINNKGRDNEGRLYANVHASDLDRILSSHFRPPGFLRRISNNITALVEDVMSDSGSDDIERYSLDVREKHVAAFLGSQVPIATEHRGAISPLDIDDYMYKGGFSGLKKALSLSPVDVVEEVKRSGLRGRGGAGFPVGEKWEVTASQPPGERILICNGDEGDPGAFMDRMLLESYPFRIIEGMIIGAIAIGAKEGVFYIRAEYPLAVERIRQAIDICNNYGILGKDILESGFEFTVKVKEGAGAFVCGEETALIASLEGKRGFPSLRPPFPAEKGLWGKPTLVNNTETYAMVPYIIRHGAEKFASIGTEYSKGSKVFALAGKVNRGGLIEVPMGITIRDIVEDIGGGIAGGKKFKAVQIGGPSGGCVPHFLADTPVDFDSLNEVGAIMGSGGLVVLDETDCMVDMARYFLSFTQNESCGKCTFCRVGTRRMLNILDRICTGKARMKELEELENLAGWVIRGSLCGLGKTAPNPVLSTLKYFNHEYEAHIHGKCPTGRCKEMVRYYVNDNCIGCTICAQQCPVEAIAFKPHEKHEIDNELCTACDMCRQACPSDAISVE